MDLSDFNENIVFLNVLILYQNKVCVFMNAMSVCNLSELYAFQPFAATVLYRRQVIYTLKKTRCHKINYT
jgi:hypothetical protein